MPPLAKRLKEISEIVDWIHLHIRKCGSTGVLGWRKGELFRLMAMLQPPLGCGSQNKENWNNPLHDSSKELFCSRLT